MLRGEEIFVAERIVEFLKRPSLSIEEGEDPPDLYLIDHDQRIPVEVTRFPRFSIKPNGKLSNRVTEDSTVVAIIKELNKELSKKLPPNTHLNPIVESPISRPFQFKNHLRNIILRFFSGEASEFSHAVSVNGSKVRLSIHSTGGKPSKIVGIVPNKNTSSDIALNARLNLSDVLKKKIVKCENLEKNLWLGILNEDSYLIDFESYQRAAREFRIEHKFEKILIISSGGKVRELSF